MSDEIYCAFAEVYGRFWEDYSAAMLAWFPALRKHFALRPCAVLDLACGTGRFAIGLAKQGFRVSGVDLSPHMLAIARRKAQKAGVNVDWSCQDMRSFAVSEPVDLVTCWFDSLNYLTDPDDLVRAFEAAHRSLAPGGTFVFDMNTIRGLAERWNTKAAINVNTPSCFVVTDTTYDAATQTNTLVMHGFVRRRVRFERFREVHAQRAYPLSSLSDWLEAVGFSDVHIFTRKDFAPADEDQFRVYVFARRPS